MFFRFSCRNCKRSFAGPLLPDMDSYGYFLLNGEEGQYGILQVIASPPEEEAWNEIERLVCEVSGRTIEEDDDTQIRILHRVVSRCLDTVEGRRMSLGGFVCPHCKSLDVKYGDGRRVGLRSIPFVGFSRFMALDRDARKRHVESIWPAACRASAYGGAALLPIARALPRVLELAQQDPGCPFTEKIRSIYLRVKEAADRDDLSLREADEIYHALMFCSQHPGSFMDYISKSGAAGKREQELTGLLGEIVECSLRLKEWSDLGE